MTLLTIFLSSFLVQNIVLIRFIAICSYIGMTSDLGSSTGMGFAVTFVTVLATAATWPIYHYILVPLHLEFLYLLVFILVIASLVQLVEFYLKKNVRGLYAAMGIYLPLITTNCAILAVTFDNITRGYSFIESIVYSLGVSAGYLLAMEKAAGGSRAILGGLLTHLTIVAACATLVLGQPARPLLATRHTTRATVTSGGLCVYMCDYDQPVSSGPAYRGLRGPHLSNGPIGLIPCKP